MEGFSMKQSTYSRRDMWIDAFKGPGLFAGCGAILGFAVEFALRLTQDGSGSGTVPGFSFFSLPGFGAAVGGGAGALWMQTRPRYKKNKDNHRKKESS
jgi:hypothetical protein